MAHSDERIWSWNSQVPPAVYKCMHTIIEEQVAIQPNKQAVFAWDGSFTYAELDTLATQLACHLASLGVGSGTMVPLCFEKSRWTIVAMLAVLKAGGAFVPLDPSQAVDRQKAVLSQLGSLVAVTSLQHSGFLTQHGYTVVPIGSGSIENLPKSTTSTLSVHSDPSSPAYVLFTSGSTGQPKGVILDHSAASSSCMYNGSHIRFNSESRVLQFSAYTFDVSVLEIFIALFYGGCICVPSDADRLDRLERTIDAMKADIAILTPTVSQLLNPKQVQSLKTLILAGEKATDEDFARWQPSVRGINGYGPTEVTMCSLNVFGNVWADGSCIGKPVGAVFWVVELEDHNQLAPIGEIGELLVEGPVLCRGYLRDPEKTAAAFIENPPWLVQGGPGHKGRQGRLYKTGDLVRYNKEDGSLVFIGRKDTQVKIHGRRVELGEIEHHVRSCIPGARHVVAEMILPGGGGPSPIIATFVALDGHDGPVHTQAEEVRVMPLPAGVEEMLLERLPAYMQPAVYFALQSLPMSTSGKADRRRLREIGTSFSAQQLADLHRGTSQGRRPVTTDAERQMQRIWASVLGIPTSAISADDSFFQLRGDSYTAMKLVALARHEGLSLSVADVFRQPHLAALVDVVCRENAIPPEEAIGAFSLLKVTERKDEVRACIARLCNIAPELVEDAYPCTPLQEGLLSLTLKTPVTYVGRILFDLPQHINLFKFRRAWQQAAKKLPILRTRVVYDSQLGLVQIVIQEDIQWQSGIGLDQYIDQDQSKHMGLGLPLARYAIITEHDNKDGPGGIRFVWTLHHSLYDGHSLSRMIELVASIYNGIPPDRPFKDFKLFSRYLSRVDTEAVGRYWQSAFKGYSSVPVLASCLSDNPRVNTMVHHEFTVPPITESNITTATLIRAAWALAVAGWRGSMDVVFGATVSGRNAALVGVDEIIGPTIATVPVRVQVGDTQTVSDYLRQIQTQAIDMIPYEHTGLHQIQQMSEEAHLACQFETLLVVQPPEEAGTSLSTTFGRWKEDNAGGAAFATYAFNLTCQLDGDAVNLEAVFDASQLSEQVATGLLERLGRISSQLALATGGKLVTDIDILSTANSERIWTWNGQIPTTIDKCIHTIVEEQAALQSAKQAVCAWDGYFTYSELDTLATQLAYHLVSEGVGPGVIVPLCFEKSRWAVVAVLAVLKTGGAFVPLDPSQAVDRQRRVLSQIGLCGLVAVTSLQYSGLLAQHGCTTISIGPDTISQLSASTKSTVSLQDVDPSSPALVLFTSGSTGEPKGVVLDHSAVSSSCIYNGAWLQVNTESRILQFSAFTFDISVLDIFISLFYGGCICIPSEAERLNQLETSINSLEANLAILTPTVSRLLDPKQVQLRTLVLVGEKGKDEDFARWGTTTRAINGYGPTECSLCSANLFNGANGNCIGKPIGSVFWVVMPGNCNQLVPLGSVGELLVEGPMLSRGYLGDPGKTAAAFIEDPSWLLRGGPGNKGQRGRRGRLYKTGDLVRYNNDGNLLFVGRKDTQVKIHGQRVELGEIENHLLTCIAEVYQVVAEVIIPAGEDSSPMLAAFLVMQDGAQRQVSEHECRVFATTPADEEKLLERLPAYMIPAVYFVLDQLPMSSSGKTARRRLREIGASFSVQQLANFRRDQKKRAVSTDAERQMQQIWSQVLGIGVEDISVDDSFFRLGGDSVAAIKVVTQARSKGLSLSVADIFRTPRLAALCAVGSGTLQTLQQTFSPFSLLEGFTDACRGRLARLCEVEPESIQDAYPCTPLQEGLFALTLKSSGDYIMRSIQQLAPGVDNARFQSAWCEVSRRLPILRTRIAPDSKYGILQIVSAHKVAWSEGADLRQYVSQDISTPMDSGQPLVRFALITDAQSQVTSFVLTLHHAVYDGLVLAQMRDLARSIYCDLPASTLYDFRSFVAYVTGIDPDMSHAYWRDALADYDGQPFPPPSHVLEPTGAHGAVESKCVLPDRMESDITIATLIRAAWAVAACVVGGSKDVLFGTTLSGRNAPITGIEAIAGPTIATVPVRIQVRAEQTVSAYLRQVQDQFLDMIPHEQTGLQYIQGLSPEARQACQFQTLLVIQQPGESRQTVPDELGAWREYVEKEVFSSYQLNITCFQEDGQVMLEATFDKDHLSEWMVSSLLERLGSIIQQLALANDAQQVGGLDTLSTAEYEQIWRWNGNLPETVDKCVHNLIEEQVSLQPDAVAVYAWDGELTYKDLDDYATYLSHHLASSGITTGTIVPLCFEKSRFTAVAMLAVLKAGCAFVLLDPSQPVHRWRSITQKTNAALIVCSENQASRCSELAPTILVIGARYFSTASKTLAGTLSRDPQSTMYVVFTSGSTGEPKGVVIQHAAFASAIFHQSLAMGYRQSVRVYDFASYAFDLSIESAMMTLATGGCLCVPSDDERRDDLTGSLLSMSAELVELTPTVARTLERSLLTGLQTLVLGGEQVLPTDFEGWSPCIRVINTYGPAECTPTSVINRAEGTGIGTGAGAVTWVVQDGDSNRLMPIGAVGELLLEGPILGRGYLGDPEKTERAFIEDPPWLRRGGAGHMGRRGRLYKTGDMVRYNEDGSLLFVGRKDSQVKIRGQRVELGEAEYHICALMGIQQVVVEIITPQGKGASSMLAAFMAMPDDTQAEVRVIAVSTAVEDALLQRLPAYMQPSVYFVLQSLPMNTSGKADRQRLRDIGAGFSTQELAHLRRGSEYRKQEVSNDAERQMQDIWARVLDLDADTISANDSFFRLGGDSVTAMKLVAQARYEGLSLSVADIFHNPRLSELSQVATSREIGNTEQDALDPFCLLGHIVDTSGFLKRTGAACELDPELIEDAYPCTPLQEGLLALTSKTRGSYTARLVLELSAHADVQRFRHACEQMARQLPILRTRIIPDSEFGLIQVVTNEQIHWRRSHSLDEYLVKDSAESMVLGKPLARYAVVEEESADVLRKSYFIWTLHHALYDGQTLNRMMKLMECIYRGVPQIDHWRNFRYFVQYLRRTKTPDVSEFWQVALEGYEPVRFLASSATETIADSIFQHSFQVPSITQADITIATLINAAWALTIAAYSGSSDVVFGTTVSGRSADVLGIDEIAGPTIATVPVRIKLLSTQEVSEFLREVQNQSIDMIPHQQAGLHFIQKLSPNAYEACQFETLLIIEPLAKGRIPEAATEGSDIGTWRDVDEGAEQAFATYTFNLTCLLDGNQLGLEAVFDSGKIGGQLAEALVHHFCGVMSQLALVGDNRTVAELEMLSDTDSRRLWNWNGLVPVALERCVHSLFEEQAAMHSDKTAIQAWDGELTYQQLDDLSTQLSNHLTSLGVNQKVIVPLCFEKSRWTVVAMLGVLKAGGAFVLLDPLQPISRLKAIIQRTYTKLMLCSDAEAVRYRRLVPLAFAIGEDFFSTLARQTPAARYAADPSSPMYIVFTSGSTGEPKGVVIPHIAFASHVLHQATYLGYRPSIRVFDFASYTFDVSIDNVFMTLLSGGCICIPSEYDRRNNLTEVLTSMSIDLVELTPSVAATVDQSTMHLETLIFGGEALRQADVDPWPEETRVINTYGPSECTPTSVINFKHRNRAEATSIGTGAGAVTWVANMSDSSRLMPIGAVGELLLEGPVVGSGYLDDPEKSEAAFIKDPPWLVQGGPDGHKGRRGRLYKTGDLVRYKNDGSLIFVGRKDTQIKIRGQRVELGEVEHHVYTCMTGAQQVTAEVIIPRGGGTTSPMLAAFIVMDGQAAPGDRDSEMRVITVPAAVEEALMRQLPAYMQPSVFFAMQSLPTTTSGKVDRRRLRELGSSLSLQELVEMRRDQEKRAISTDTERQMQKIWARVLGIDNTNSICATDNFFRLGGDSVTAMKLVAQARRDGLVFSVADIFRKPWLSALSSLIGHREMESEDRIPPFSLLNIVAEGEISEHRKGVAKACNLMPQFVEDIYPCTALQEGLLALASKTHGAYTERLVLELLESVHLARFRNTWEELVRRLPILRTRIVHSTRFGLVQVVVDEAIPWKRSASLTEYIQRDKMEGMGLNEPLARYAIVGRNPSYFVWTLHHALYDGFSLGQMIKLAGQIYESIPEQETCEDFKYFARYIAEAKSQASRDYWQESFTGYSSAPFPAPLPSQREVSADASLRLEMPVPITVFRSNTTMATLIRSAWAITIAASHGSADVIFGAVVSGRNADVEGINEITGPTIATVPVRIQLEAPATQTVSAFLRQVQAQSVDMIPYEQAGLDWIQQISDEAYQACQFQTLLVVQPREESESEALSGTECFGKWVDADGEEKAFSTYMFNLTCFLSDDTVEFEATYDARLVSEPLATALLERLRCVIQQLSLADDSQTVAEINALSVHDLEQIWSWNKIVPETVNKLVHCLVEEQVVLQPHAMAVDAWDGQFTYAELDTKAIKLAKHLVSFGIGGPIKIVPLCFEKSRWAVVAMIATLKAGAAFLHLDPSQPKARLERIIKRTGAEVILSSKDQAKTCFGLTPNVLTVGSESLSRQLANTTNGHTTTSPDTAMYVIFTSGSTGEPKGVVISHAAFASHVFHQAKHLGYRNGLRVFDFASYMFDVSVDNVFMTLISGGCICIPSDYKRLNRLTETLESMSAELVHLTPSVAATLDQEMVAANLQTLLLGGEAVHQADIDAWPTSVRVVNTYGPAECTPTSVMDLTERMDSRVESTSEATSIGHGVGAVTWVVDASDSSRLAPVGAIGELLLEGPIVGSGYLVDSERTEASFIENPPWLLQGGLGSKDGLGRKGRLYKTGDLVRYNEDGSLLLISRKDTQVKVRGQRVELGEVEVYLRICVTGVQQVAAEMIVPGGDSGEAESPMLAAFLVMRGNPSQVPENECRIIAIAPADQEQLSQQLPSHMLPAVYFELDRLPLNSSGKIDRRRLRDIGGSFSAQQLAELQRDPDQQKQAPATEAERRMQQIWARILGINADSISANDSFFWLGGDSIAAMKLVAQARRDELSFSFSVADVFRNPRLSALSGSAHHEVKRAQSDISPFSLLNGIADIPEYCKNVAKACNFGPEAIEDIYPCTPLQEGLLFLTSRTAGAYTERLILNLPPNTDLPRFRYAWEEVTRRLPILRTRIVHTRLGLVQVVVKEKVQWGESADLDEYLERDKLDSMSLNRPLVRYATAARPPSFVWTLHHAVYDGHSMGQIIKLAGDIYRDTSLHQLQENYKDFKFFAGYLARLDNEAGREYWRKAFAGYDSAPFPASLVSLQEKSQEISVDGFLRHSISIPTAPELGITTPNLIRAAWALTIAASSGPDVVFGAVVSGRNADLEGIDEILGPVIATVPVRIQVLPSQEVGAFLQQVQAQSIDMISYEQFGLHRIQQVSEEAHKACQFQSLLVIQPPEEAEAEVLASSGQECFVGEWREDGEEKAFSTYAFNLTCLLSQETYPSSRETIELEAAFDTTQVSKPLAAGLLERLDGVIQQLSSTIDDGRMVADIEILSRYDRQRIWSWNHTVPDAVSKCVHHLIEEQSMVQPHATAVCAWDGEFTYAELDVLATHLSRYLQHLGIGLESRVPLCCEKSKWTVVAILAVLKAGGAFILLDVSQPVHRWRHIIQKTGATLILCSESQVSKYVDLVPGTEVLAVGAQCLSPLQEEATATVALPRREAQSAQSTMYIVFTSGSTGEPKGVVISHTAFASAIFHQSSAMGYGRSVRTYDFASYAFDLSIEVAMMTLATGGCLCVPSDNDRRDDLTGSLLSMSVDLVELTPSVARSLDRSRLRDHHGLKTIVLGGEAVLPSDLEGWPPGVRVINTYGPAECTPTSVINLNCAMPTSIGNGTGCVTWVVDADNCSKLVPVGTVGELVLEGPIVGSGYLHDSERTEAAFINNPPWLVEGGPSSEGRHGRLYKTSDLVRYQDDGSLVFVGRKDAQVKIRGQRVELGEVEYHILAHITGVQQVAAEVIVPGGTGASPMLVGFVVMGRGNQQQPLESNSQCQVATIAPADEEELSERLPSYMIPAIYFKLNQLPTNSSGKVDRRRLRELGAGFSVQELVNLQNRFGLEGSNTPSTDAERALQAIWARVLNIDAASIGVDDSFFRLGGDSITAMQVSSAARSSLGNVSTVHVLRRKTIRRIAASINSAVSLASRSVNGDVVQPDVSFVLSPIQQLYMHFQNGPHRCFDQHFFLRLRSVVTPESLSKAMHTIVSRHPMLRARFDQKDDGQWEQRVVPDDDSNSLFYLDVVTDPDPSFAEFAAAGHDIRRCREALNIERGPIISAVLFGNPRSQCLFITAHHLVIDLVSWRILLEDLEALLATDQQASVSLPMSSTSFQVWCARQEKYAANLDPEAESPSRLQRPRLEYWDVANDANIEGATTTKDFSLDSTTSSAILGWCNDVFDTRPVELMVAALIYSFSLVFSDRPAPAVFSEGHGREAFDDGIDLSRTIGWFTTIFPIETTGTPDTDLLDLIRQTKDAVRQLPANGWSWFASRFANQARAQAHLSDFPVEILFNFSGHYQQLEREESFFENLELPARCEPETFAGLRRFSIFDVLMDVDSGCLTASIVYPKKSAHQHRIAAWVESYESQLTQLTIILRGMRPEWTLTSFPLAFNSYKSLDEFRTSLLPLLPVSSPDEIEDIFPCTPIQVRILSAQAKDSRKYRCVHAFEIVATRQDSQIDLNRIEQAWRKVVRRHPLLRALLVDNIPGNNATMHIILRDPEPSVSHFRVNNGDESLPSNYLPATPTTIRYQKGGLQHHLSVYRVSDQRAHIRLEINHAILDADSSDILMRDFQWAYSGSLDPIAPSYSEYVKHVQLQPREDGLRFWTKRLIGVKPCLFPTQEEQEVMHHYKTTFTLDVLGLEVDKIRRFCAQSEITAAAVFHLAWALVLHHETGSAAPCFGTLSSGRDVPIGQVHDIFGPLICLLPCVIQLDRQQSVLDALHGFRSDYLSSLPHQTSSQMEVNAALDIGPGGLYNTAISFVKGGEDVTEADVNTIVQPCEGLDPVEVCQSLPS
ncbi:unnamed protein product [Clonostachys rhizophaga]|uniref:Carrier domain-containing protein n=1 Tax=Clonostachys rhizophaga TaxID=160324 RepID=A0A9N9YKK7_9HYPO|nr:unnamed protein product [Clonostachys rhizophaga]